MLKRILMAAILVCVIGIAFLFWFVERPTGNIIIHGINARSIEGVPGTLYIFANFTNDGGPEWLNSVESNEAPRVELFNPAKISKLPIPAGSSPSLAVDGAHIRMFGLEGALDIGRLVPITLNFNNAKRLKANVRVGSPLNLNDLEESGEYGMGRVLNLSNDIPVPKIELRAEKIAGGWRIHVDTEDFEFTDHSEGMSETNFASGHGHLYLSGLKLKRVYSQTVDLGEIGQGKHEVRVVLVSDDHQVYKSNNQIISAATTIDVSNDI